MSNCPIELVICVGNDWEIGEWVWSKAGKGVFLIIFPISSIANSNSYTCQNNWRHLKAQVWGRTFDGKSWWQQLYFYFRDTQLRARQELERGQEADNQWVVHQADKSRCDSCY